MQPATKRAAIEKLDALRIQVGYPSAWRDYTGLALERGMFYENVRTPGSTDSVISGTRSASRPRMWTGR